MMKKILIFLVIAMVLFLPACKSVNPGQNVKDTIILSSSAFNNLGRIPVKYTGNGKDVSPPLHWSNVPENAHSLAIAVDDPDAPHTFTHWIIFNIPSNETQLAEGIPQELILPDGAKQGKNDFGNIGYNGPKPPSGQIHHYRFTIYALDETLNTKPGISRKEFFKAISGHILAKGTLIGLYGDQILITKLLNNFEFLKQVSDRIIREY